ncbi:hypothetical protein KKE25_03600, partial [Patescibacteria group bacterium]|nr:hypothetical protein [Patescibacteria group bacterium]
MAIDGHKILNYLYLGREKLVQAILYLVSFMFVRMYLLFLFALNIINWLLAFYINNNVSQNLVVLHYNVNLGVNLIGNARDIYIIPTLGLAFIAINFLLLLNIFFPQIFSRLKQPSGSSLVSSIINGEGNSNGAGEGKDRAIYEIAVINTSPD